MVVLLSVAGESTAQAGRLLPLQSSAVGVHQPRVLSENTHRLMQNLPEDRDVNLSIVAPRPPLHSSSAPGEACHCPPAVRSAPRCFHLPRVCRQDGTRGVEGMGLA